MMLIDPFRNTQEIEAHAAHRKNSTASIVMHQSNSELNSMCPHTKGSTKSEW